MKVTVDESECAATGQCAFLAPSVFELPHKAWVVTVLTPEVPAEHLAAVEDAVTMCPVQALSLVDSD